MIIVVLLLKSTVSFLSFAVIGARVADGRQHNGFRAHVSQQALEVLEQDDLSMK